MMDISLMSLVISGDWGEGRKTRGEPAGGGGIHILYPCCLLDALNMIMDQEITTA